jgi:hypothetical protein
MFATRFEVDISWIKARSVIPWASYLHDEMKQKWTKIRKETIEGSAKKVTKEEGK